MTKNHQYLLASRPVGMPTKENWSFVEIDIPSPQAGEFLIKILYISLDPAMRGWMNDTRSYIAPVGIGEVMRAGAVGKIIASNHSDFQVGEYVTGAFGVQEYAISNGKGVNKVDGKAISLPIYTGTLGTAGLTAYFGLLEVGTLKEGETVLVSGAAGAVGSIVGQIAKIKNCKVIGLAGGKEKCALAVEEFGYDACIDYKNEDIRKGIKQHAPEGIDVYFDNVGGEILDIALTQIRKKARVVICGAISQYNSTTGIEGPKNYLSLLINSARMEGFVVFDFAKQYGRGISDMVQWMQQGKLKSKEHIVEGIETFPERLLMLFRGENFGKLVLKVGEE